VVPFGFITGTKSEKLYFYSLNITGTGTKSEKFHFFPLVQVQSHQEIEEKHLKKVFWVFVSR
jgi:hypothetical protein